MDVYAGSLQSRLKGNPYISEFWNEANEFVSSGWRIQMRDTGKIVPRASEVDEVSFDSFV